MNSEQCFEALTQIADDIKAIKHNIYRIEKEMAQVGLRQFGLSQRLADLVAEMKGASTPKDATND